MRRRSWPCTNSSISTTSEIRRAIGHGGGDLVHGRHADGDAAALLAARRLHHHLAVPIEECLERGGLGIRRDLVGNLHTGSAHHPGRRRLVVADRHGDRGRELRQALAAMDRAAAIGEAEEAALRVGDLHLDAAPARLADDDLGVGVERLVQLGPGEQLLVDGVLALHREERHALETEFFVQRDRLRVVVQDGEVEVGGAARGKIFDEAPHQGLAHAGLARLRIDGEAPQRRSALGVVEGAVMVDAGDGAQDLARRFILGQEIADRARVAVAPRRSRAGPPPCRVPRRCG